MCLEVPGFNVWPSSIGVGGLDGCTWVVDGETDKARIRRTASEALETHTWAVDGYSMVVGQGIGIEDRGGH